MSLTTSKLDLTAESVKDTTSYSPVASNFSSLHGKSHDWHENDDRELFQRIKKALPIHDTMKYDSRISHMNWEKISFGEYSAEECKQRWERVQENLRRYRLANELVEDAITWRLSPRTNFNKSNKSQEHPNYPKKHSTPYMIFFLEKKNEIHEKNRGMEAMDLTTVISKLYNEMDEHGKQIYIEKAKKEKEQFELEQKKFMIDYPDNKPRKSVKLPMKVTAPKVPTPFKLFLDAKLAEFLADGMNSNEAREKSRKIFKELDNTQRLEWIYRSLQQENQYNQDMERFKTEHPEAEIGAKKSLLSKEEKHLKEKAEGKPDKPPNCGYALYSKKMLASTTLRHLDTKDRMTEISRSWKRLQEEERKTYNDEVQQLNLTYKIKQASYLESLSPDQRLVELKNSQEAKKIKLDNEQLMRLVNSNADNQIEEEDDCENSGTNKDINDEAKLEIRKIKSSLQIFFDTNRERYKMENPEMNQMELSYVMIKTYSKLSKDEMRIYENMALKSLKKVSPLKNKLLIQSQRKVVAQKKDSTTKSSKEKSKKKPLWALNQQLFMKEPPKPPTNPIYYYACRVLKDNTLPLAVMEEKWIKLSDSRRRKHAADHKKTIIQYGKEFEHFIRSLSSEEFKSFRLFMKKRETSNDTIISKGIRRNYEEKNTPDSSSAGDRDNSTEEIEEDSNYSGGTLFFD